MISIILALALCGFVVWMILQIPMPAPVQKIIIGVVCFLVVIWVLQALGFSTGLPRVRP